jgi:hypothetical protein
MGELIVRLEAATEGSRKLDLAIEIAFGRCSPTADLWHDLARWREPLRIRPYVYEESSQELPHYTQSLDAAMTLIPEMMGWEL